MDGNSCVTRAVCLLRTSRQYASRLAESPRHQPKTKPNLRKSKRHAHRGVLSFCKAVSPSQPAASNLLLVLRIDTSLPDQATTFYLVGLRRSDVPGWAAGVFV
jgi:hypothetical protein